MLGIGFGYEVKGLDDPKIKADRKLAQLISETALPGALLVNDLPFCEHTLPYWASSLPIRTTSTIHPRMAFLVQL